MFTEKDWVPFTREELGWEEVETQKDEKPESGFNNLVFTLPDGTVVDKKDEKYLFQERPTLGEFTGKMLGAGTDQVQGLGYGVVGLAGDVVGSEAIKDFGLEGYQRNMQDAAVAREEAGMVDFDEIDGVGSAGKWAYGTLLEQLPQLAPTLALGGAGGIAGRQLVKKGLQEVIEEGVSAGLSRKAAEAAVANAVASRGGAKAFLTGTADKAAARQLMAGGFSREATEAALGRVAAGKLAPQVGVAAGNIASGQAMSMGSIYGDTEDAGLAVTYGAAAGAVEGLADTILFSPFAKRAFGVDVAERSIKNKTPGTWTTETPNSKTKITIGSPVLDKAAKGFVKGVAVEGPLEEYPQTYIEQMARAEADPTFDINSEEAKRERLNAMAAGSVVGGTIGPVGGALEALAPRTKNALQGLVQKPLSDPETGLPPNETDPFTSEAREYEPEAYDIGNGINARRFKIKGTETTGWAIDNPTEAVLKEFGNSGYVDDGKLILTSNSAGNTLAVRGDTARAKALGKIQEDDDQEEQSKEPEKREPLDFDLSTEGEADPNADVLRDYGIKPAVSIKPAPEAVGRRVRYEGYEGTLTRDGARYKISTPDNQTVELPADTEVEMVSELPAVRGDSALTTAVTASPDANLVSDYGIKKTAEPASAPKAPAPEPAPGITRGDAWELSQSTLALPEVNIVDAIGAAAENEDLDDNAVSLLDDAQKSLENAITQIEKRDIPQAEKEEATKPLYDRLLQVDEIQQLYTPEKAPSALLTPTTPLEQEVEKQVAEHQQKVAEQKQAQAEALEARTPEQTQGFVASLKQGDKVSVDLDGPNDITGTFEGTTDEGQVIVKDQKTRKRQVVRKEQVDMAPDLPPVPTFESVAKAAIGQAPTAESLKAAGLKPTGGTTTERVGGEVFADRPTFSTTTKDKIDQRPLKLTATLYKDSPNFHYVHEGNKEKKKTWTRDILRAMDRGYEVRIPNSVEVPAGVQTEAVGGTDYRVVTGVDFTFDGVNFGTFLRGSKGVRHNGNEREGLFAEAWSTNPDYNNIRLQRSKQNTKTRKDRGTDASTRAGQRASKLNPIGQSIFQAIFGSQNRTIVTKNDPENPNADESEKDFNVDISWPLGSFGGRIDSYLRNEASGLDVEGREGFSEGAENKIFNSLSISELTDAVDLSPEQRSLVDSTISAYLTTQRSGGVKFASKGKLTQATINKLKKDLTPSKADEKLVNRTLNAMQELAMFSNPRTQGAVLSEVASEEYRKQSKRPKGSVSLDQNIGESGDATLADVLDTQGGKANEDDGNLNAAVGELSEEQEATNAEQEKAIDEIVDSIDDRIGGIEASSALSELVNSLSPLEKIAYSYISTPERARKDQFYGQLEDQIEDPDDLIEDLKEKIAGLAQRVSGRTLSPAVRPGGQTRTAAGLEGGVLNRTSKTAEIRRIKRRYIQGKAGLTDEQMLAMSDDEIDRAYLAYNARADEARAAKAQDAVVSAAPAIDQLVDLDSASLLSEYARELAQDLKAGEMGKIREANFAELTRLGAFASTREFLSRIADPAYKMPRDMQLRAKAFLDLEKKRGFKLDAIEIQAANFLQTGTQERASWAGLMGRNADYTSFGIYLNLDQAHDRFSAANTALHELSHVTVLAKKHGKVKLSKDEEKAISDLETLRRRAVLRAGDASPAMKAAADAAGITDPAAKVDFYEKEIRKEVARNPEFRGYNGLQNFDEFVVEMTGSPEFVDLLGRLGFGTATGKRGFSGMIRDAFKAILKLINSNISADSEIGRAFMDSWNLIYAGTKPTVAPGELLQATRGITAATETKPAATVKKSQKPKAPQPAPAQPSTTPNAETTQAPQSNNQPTAQPVPENAEVPEASRPGEGSGAAVEPVVTFPEIRNAKTLKEVDEQLKIGKAYYKTFPETLSKEMIREAEIAAEETKKEIKSKAEESKPKRGKGRPPKREMRDRTALPATREAFEEEMAQGEMTPEEREAELADEQEAPQSPAGRRTQAEDQAVAAIAFDFLESAEEMAKSGLQVARITGQEERLVNNWVLNLSGMVRDQDTGIPDRRHPYYNQWKALQAKAGKEKVSGGIRAVALQELKSNKDKYPNYYRQLTESPAPQSPAGRRPRAVQAAPFAEGEREMAELRADNFSDILFYAGISEEDFYNAVGSGVLTSDELEKGYINDVAKMLGNIADDDTVPSPLRHVAQMMLDQGHDFSKVRFRISRGETDWAGLYTPGRTANSGEVAVQLGANHLGGIAQTIVHEALHHVSYYKASPGYRLTATERKALRDIERIRQFAERAAIAKQMLPGENVTEARRRLQSSDRSLYGLTEVDEFITEILTNPSFQSFLVGLKPMQGIEKKGGLIRNLLDQVFAYLKDFIFGMDVSGDSLLTQGLDNVMSLIQTPQDPRKVREVASMIQGDLASRATAPIERYGEALLRIAREKGQNLFSLPYNRPGSESTDLKTVLDSFDARFSVLESTDGNKFISLTKDIQPDDSVLVPGHFLLEGADNFTVTEARVVSIKDGQAKVLEKNFTSPKTEEKTYPLANLVKRETFMRVEPQPPGRWVIDSSQGNSGKIPMSDSIYQGIYKWAKNNGAKVVPDTSTSFAGNMRRNAHQLSSALREQSAEHFIPTDNQLSQMFPDKPDDKRLLWWGTRNTAQKIEALARAEVKYVEQILPDLVQLTYDPTSDSIMASGERLDNQRARQRVREILEQAKGKGPSDTDRVGERTAYRYLAAKSWLSASQERPWISGSIGSSGTLDRAFMSPAGDAKKMIAKLTGAETKTTFTGGTYEKGGLLSTDGKLDKRAGDLWRKRNMQVGAQERMVNIAVNKLVNAVKAARKAGQEPPTDVMNTALGNLDNPLTQAQRTEIKRLREIDEEAANAQEGAYMAKNREAFKVKQAEALRRLPTEIAEAIQEMTEHITALSGALKKAGILEPGLAATIDANLGIYLHRSYEIFDNPAHKDKIKKDEAVMTAAENLLRRQIESRNAQKLIDDVAKAGGILSKADAERQARGTAKREEIDRVMEQLLAVGEESLGGVILRGRIPGQKDLSILDARGNIAPEIQALWGRYEDPTINYAKTVMKISTLVANHQFLAETRALGLQEGWLYEGDDHPPGYLKIASENNKSLAPLSGLYGNRDLVEALYAMYPPAGIAENYEWVKFFAKLTGMSMASKTVLSAASHVRNFAGNFLNLAASGNLGINDILNGGRYKKALDLTIRSTFSNASAQQFKDTIKELVELGVLNESLTAGLLNDLIGTKRVAKDPAEFSNWIVNMLAKKMPAAIWDNAQKSYQSGDEFFKVVIYLSELDKYRKAMPQWSEQKLKENAAKIARDVHWTYSLSPVAVGKIKQFPFIAPFITFTTEVIRTTKNTMELAYREIKEGNRTGNKELAAIGWKRVRGMFVAAFAPSMIAGAIGIQAGISGEDDDDLRRFLPDWQKNSQLLVFKNKDGKVSFVDVSYLDPYEYWKRPITAFLRALGADSESTAMERIAQGAVDAGAQLLNPFAAEQILSGAILDIARNKKESGQELWNPQDTGTRIAAKIGDHLWNAMEPGTLVTGGRIWDAWTGKVSDSGRSYGLINELASVGLGQRVSELDVEQSLGFKASQYSRNLRDASSLFTREFSNKGTRSADQIMDAYNRANDATFDLGKEFREDLLSAIRLGKISQKRAQEILSASRLSKEDIKMLRTGRYLRYEPSPQQIKLAKELGNENRIRDVRQAERAAATNIPLR
jgi:hypothetical protein